MQTNTSRGRVKGSPPTAGSFKAGNTAGAKRVGTMPMGRFITAQLIRLMQEEIPDPNDKSKVKARAKRVYFFCLTLVNSAIAGDSACLKMVMDRIEGTPISTMNLKMSDDPDNLTPEEVGALAATREKLKTMTREEKLALYNQLTSSSETRGEA